MSTISAYLGIAGLTDVGYRFYNVNTPVGPRVTAGVTDTGEGWYVATGATLAGDHVRWDSTGTADAAAREDLAVRLALESLQTLTTADIADAILARNIAGGSSSGRTVKQALAFLRNKWTLVGSTLTVYGTDDTTVLWTATISSDPSAEPVTGSDPA